MSAYLLSQKITNTISLVMFFIDIFYFNVNVMFKFPKTRFSVFTLFYTCMEINCIITLCLIIFLFQLVYFHLFSIMVAYQPNVIFQYYCYKNYTNVYSWRKCFSVRKMIIQRQKASMSVTNNYLLKHIVGVIFRQNMTSRHVSVLLFIKVCLFKVF